MLCGYRSINALNDINKDRRTKIKAIYEKREYIPKMHGLRDGIKDTPYQQIEMINKSVIAKAKENKVFRKNKIDGLTAMTWDGVELNETCKNIEDYQKENILN